jgi:CHAT domain-containing protein
MINSRKLYQTIGSPFYSLMYNKSKQFSSRNCFFLYMDRKGFLAVFFLLILWLVVSPLASGQPAEYLVKGEKMLFLNQTDSLGALVEKAQNTYRQAGNWEAYLTTTVPLIRMDILKEWYQLPEGYYEDLLNIVEENRLEGLPATAKIYEGYAKTRLEKEDVKTARKYFQLAEKLNLKHFDDFSLERAELYTTLAHFHSELLELKEGQKVSDKASLILANYYNDSSSYAPELFNHAKWLLSTVFFNKATLSQLGGRHIEASEANDFSLQLRHELSFLDSSEYADNFNLIGMIYEHEGDYATGIQYLNNALNIYEKPPFKGSKGHALTLNNLGSVYQEYFSYPKSINLQKVIDYHREAMAIHQTNGYKKGFAMSLLYIANAHRDMKAVDSFDYYINRFNAFIPQNLSDDPQVLSEYYAVQGLAAYDRGDIEGALGFFKKQYEQIVEYGDPYSTNKVIVLRSLGVITLHLGDYHGALDLFYRGSELLGVDRELLKNYQLPDMQSVTALNELAFMVENIANVYKLWTDAKPDSVPLLETSLNAQEMAVNMLDSLRARIFSSEMRNLFPETYYHIYMNGINFAYRLYQKTGEKQYLERAWAILEKGKGSQLISGIRSSALSAGDGVIKTELDYRGRVAEINRKIVRYKQVGKNGKVEALTRELIALKQEQSRFIAKINKDVPSYFPQFFNPSVISMSEFKEIALKEDEVFVDYFISSRTLTIIGMSLEESVFTQIELDDQFVADFHSLIDFCHLEPDLDNQPEKTQSDYLRMAYSAYQHLIAPVADIAQGKSLILSPLSGFHRMPFEIFLTEPIDNGGKMLDYATLPYLFQKYPIQYAFSANTYAYGKTDADVVEGGRVLGMAPVEFSDYENAGELTFSKEEIEKIKTFYPVDTYYFEDATEVIFKRKAAKYPIIHLATHGKQDSLNPLLPHLLFYGAKTEPTDSETDNILYLSEIYGMPLSTELVVLSACYTAEGKRQIGEGVLSVGRGFRYVGAKSVLMSIWQVTDAASPTLLGKFYELMSKGESKRMALHKAKKWFLKNEARNLMHPYFWSTFVLYGDPVSIKPASGPGMWVLGILAGVFILVIGYWYRRQKSL